MACADDNKKLIKHYPSFNPYILFMNVFKRYSFVCIVRWKTGACTWAFSTIERKFSNSLVFFSIAFPPKNSVSLSQSVLNILRFDTFLFMFPIHLLTIHVMSTYQPNFFFHIICSTRKQFYSKKFIVKKKVWLKSKAKIEV